MGSQRDSCSMCVWTLYDRYGSERGLPCGDVCRGGTAATCSATSAVADSSVGAKGNWEPSVTCWRVPSQLNVVDIDLSLDWLKRSFIYWLFLPGVNINDMWTMDADRRRGGSRPACTVVKTGVNVWWQAEMEAKTKFFTGSEQQTRHEYLHQMEQRRKQGMKMWKRAVRWKWYGHAGWSCSLRSSLPLCLSTSPPLSLSSGGWHFPSSVWPLTEGGMNGGVERGERAGWKGEGRMSSRRTSKCSPADLLGELGKKNVCAWKPWLETALMLQYWTFWGGTE